MSKVADYLNEHILGEVTTHDSLRKRFSTDASVLSITPEMIVYPRITNDIRKIARFSWQLAEKGHVLPITVRGGGTDQTGAAIGSGVIVSTTAHMKAIFELDAKQKLVRLQPGVTFQALNSALALQGMHIPSYPASQAYSTIGGAIANNASGVLSGKYGDTGRWVHQLEVVLANGDILQTGRISKRELNRKKGLQTFEGEIYRQIDNIITDNKDMIEEKIASDVRDNIGYSGIAQVKQKDGSVDLAPLFIGSQGTLGIVSEAIMKTEFLSQNVLVGAVAFESYDAARDAIDILQAYEPSILEVIDAQLFESALQRGKKYAFYNDATEQGTVGALIVFGFDDFSERVRNKKAKRIIKTFTEPALALTIAADQLEAESLLALRDVAALAISPAHAAESAPPLFDGAYVPTERFEDFERSVEELAKKYDVTLPLYGHAGQGVFYARPVLQLKKVGDKQKVFKLLGDYANLVASHNGHLIGESGEGRLKAPFAYKQLDEDVIELFDAIRAVFDPQSVLNPGVKQQGNLKHLVSILRSEYDFAPFGDHAPTN
jgi:FAD/FMN-containing dehydrogenase